MHWTATTEDETEEVGARLAAAIPWAKSLCVIYLQGELGAGKTTLARGFLRACGVTGTVRSPTYTLLEVYEAAEHSVLHLDLYRLRDPVDLEALGLRQWARHGHIWLIEWAELASGNLPPADLVVRLVAQPAAHTIDASACSALGEMWLERVAGAAGVENRADGT